MKIFTEKSGISKYLLLKFPVLFSLPILACCASAQVFVVGGLNRIMEKAPGEEVQGRIIVRNPHDRHETVRVYLTDYKAFADGRRQYPEAGSLPRSNAGWVHVTPREQRIPPGEAIFFHYAVRAPEEEELSGTYWSMLMVQPVAPETLKAPGGRGEKPSLAVMTLTRVGVLLTSNIMDTGGRNLEFSRRRLETGEEGVFFRLDMENTGERLLRLDVWADIFDGNGFSIGRFPAGRRNIYPGSSWRMSINLAGVPPGDYHVLVVADGGDDGVFGGRYRMEISGSGADAP